VEAAAAAAVEPASSVAVVCCSGQRAESRENSSGPANKSLHMRQQPVTEPRKDAEKHSAKSTAHQTLCRTGSKVFGKLTLCGKMFLTPWHFDNSTNKVP
jgi:hypothetical protein